MPAGYQEKTLAVLDFAQLNYLALKLWLGKKRIVLYD